MANNNYESQTYQPNQNTQRPGSRPIMPDLPTGRPSGPTTAPLPGELPIMMAPLGEQSPQTMQSIYYTPGYLRTQIGKMLRVEFLIGSSGPLVDRIGTLLSVGASYILIRPIGTDDTLLCDIYSIKFVTVYREPIELQRPV